MDLEGAPSDPRRGHGQEQGQGKSPWRHPAGIATGLLLALALLVAGILRSDFLIDDAYISFRYARSWAEWGVPAYNPGEQPPVEGYSNPSWVWLLRQLHAQGVQIEFASRLIGGLCGAATLVWMVLWLRSRTRLGDLELTVAALALALFPPFVLWCTGGLETALFGLLAFGTFAVAGSGDARWTRGVAAGALGLLLALTRPEGLAFAVALLAAAQLQRGRPLRPSPGLLFGWLLPVLVGYGAFLAWRHGVHGAWLPNTVHAKTGGLPLGRGLRTVASFGLLFITPLLALLAPVLSRREDRPLAMATSGVLLLALAENIVVGGDWMPMFRLLAPFSAFLAIAFVLALRRLPGGALLGMAGVVLAALPAFDLHAAPRSWREALVFRSFARGYESEWERRATGLRNVANFLAIGEGLGSVAEPSDSITMGAIGAVGWASGITILDRNGLIDPEIARGAPVRAEASAGHDRRVPRSWFLDQEPTYWEALLVQGEILSAEAPGGRKAARAIAARLGEEDAELLQRSLPEYHVLAGDEPRTLVLLRNVEPSVGAPFWQALQGRR